MRPRDFDSSVSRSVSFLLDIQLGLYGLRWRSLQPSHEFRAVALDGDSAYEDVYQTGMRYGDYNVVLKDGSYFQFQVHGTRRNEKLRYAFYPNPHSVEPFDQFCEEMGEQDSALAAELYAQHIDELGETRDTRLVFPVRYEFDPVAYRHLVHPSSHIHFGDSFFERLALNHVLTPAGFTYFVVKHVYPREWARFDASRASEPTNELDWKYCTERSACRLVAFSEYESNQEHLCLGGSCGARLPASKRTEKRRGGTGSRRGGEMTRRR